MFGERSEQSDRAGLRLVALSEKAKTRSDMSARLGDKQRALSNCLGTPRKPIPDG